MSQTLSSMPADANLQSRLNAFLAACESGGTDQIDPVLVQFLELFRESVEAGAQIAARQASVQIVNLLLKAGRLAACLDVVKLVQSHLSAPELDGVRRDLSRHVASAMAKQSGDAIRNQTDLFVSSTFRPVLARDHGLIADGRLVEKVAIVMQGPILHDLQFTLETLKLYDRMFPSVELVLSTWEGEEVDQIQQAGLKRLHLLQHSKPATAGPANINFQIKSAREGVRYARDELGVEFVLKTRTDMRLNNPNALLDMLALLDQFPRRDGGAIGGRLLLISDVVKYMMYAVPDKNMFGATDDMWSYWDQPEDLRPIKNVPPQATMRAYSAQHPAEIYLLRNYLAKLNWPVNETLADHFNVIRDLFVVYDRAAADLYWHKYAYHLEYRFKQFAYNQILEEFGFNDWLRLQTSRRRLCDTEVIVDADQASSISPLIQSALV